MDQEEKKDGNYSLNKFGDIAKYDPTRLLDLGNSLQVAISQNKPEINEEARASSNFEKLTEDRPRPVSHTLVDAIRVLPDIIALLAGPATAAVKKAIGKKAAKNAGSKIAKKLVGENTSDIAQAFNNSKLLQRDAKDAAAKKWVRNLFENKEAINRVAGKNLSDDEIKAVTKELPNAITEKIKLYNEDVDKLKTMTSGIKDLKVTPTKDLDILRRHFVDNKILTKAEWEKLGKNLAELPEYNKNMSFSHINVDRILKGIPKEKHNIVKEVFKNIKSLVTPVSEADAILKAADASINDVVKPKIQGRNIEIRPYYFTKGSKPTPVSDFFASVFNVDFDDPARFNKKDIDTFFEFLEDIGTIEPGIKDKWTARQKVSVMRELLSDEILGQSIKEKWANSEHKKNLNKYYNNRGE